ncbi:hypothetical protein EGW08_016524, partial [Elysia chlorotica]
RTPSTISLTVFLFCAVHGKLDITSEHDVLTDFLTKQDRLLCAVIKYTDINDTLEDNVLVVSQYPKFKRNIAGVIQTPFNGRETNTSLSEPRQSLHQPSVLQCFIDHGLRASISSSQSPAQISKWLISLKRKMKQMWQYDVNQLEVLRSKKDIVVLAMPTQTQMASIDMIGNKVTERLMKKGFSATLVLIHPNSKNS